MMLAQMRSFKTALARLAEGLPAQACLPFCRKAMSANVMSTRDSVPQRDQGTERSTNHTLTKQQPDA